MSREEADSVRRYVIEQMRSGVYGENARLPTERNLSETLGVSRSVVRAALTTLEAEKLIYRHVGRGTFVSATNDAIEQLPGEAAQRDFSPAMIMEARRALEVQLVELAVINGTTNDIQRVGEAARLLRDTDGALKFEAADSEFHRAIALSTRNELLVLAFDVIVEARRSREWRLIKAQRHTLNPNRRAEVHAEHDRIVAAIRARDAEGARSAMVEHLRRVSMNLIGQW